MGKPPNSFWDLEFYTGSIGYLYIEPWQPMLCKLLQARSKEKKTEFGGEAGEMAQWVKDPAAEPDALSTPDSPGLTWWKRTGIPRLSSDLHIRDVVWAAMYTDSKFYKLN